MRVEIEPDHIGQGRIAAKLGLGQPQDPVIGLVHVANGQLKTDPSAPLPRRLAALADQLEALIAEQRPDAAAVEEVFVNKNPQSTLKLGQARGVVIMAQPAKLLDPDQASIAAVEEVFVNKNPQSTLKLGQARGVALMCAARSGVAVGEYAARLVKKAVVGTGGAEKAQVHVPSRLGDASVGRLRSAG